MEYRRFFCLLGAIAAVLLTATRTSAHDPGLSTVEIRMSAGEIIVSMTFAPRDLSPVFGEAVERDAPHEDASGTHMTGLLREPIEALSRDGVSLENGELRLSPREVSVVAEADGSVTLRIRFGRGPSSTWAMRSTVLARLSRGHRQYVTVHDIDGALVAEALLDAGRDTMEWVLPPRTDAADSALPESPIDPAARTATIASAATPVNSREPLRRAASHGAAVFGAFVLLGIEHVLMGYDHLIFLFGLLIVGGRFGRIAGVITAFTAAHSITLALATLDLVSIPSHLVEALIAASIVYVGMENLVRRDLQHRWRLAFAFGLVHGLGFASVLGDLGVHTAGRIGWLLAGFNVGVELGQVAIVACVLPLVWRLARSPRLAWQVATVGSFCIVCAGGFWVVERTM